ncbi:MAG: S-methyl-5-thioribose-1-phosphate isomerase [bacterium]|nr:S-methyl-5-thioribose-1-phosphate isomerase [bacterium]
MNIKTIEWLGDSVCLIDQKKLPLKKIYVKCSNYKQVAEAIRSMQIRGAPAIGVAAAFGIALGGLKTKTEDKQKFISEIKKISEFIAKTRPTAVNLFWAVRRMNDLVIKNSGHPVPFLKKLLVAEAIKIYDEDIAINEKIGKYGAVLIKNNDTILTHCNAGALATAGYGTALGVIRKAHSEGKKIKVFVDETRPFMQGARLTAWELKEEGIPHVLITDNMAGYFMKKGMINGVIVGADRIAVNGDTANKIGTYSVAVLAKEHKIPFYVAAPLSTIDISIPDGSHIPIEERNPREVTHIMGKQIPPDGTVILNPAFDVTPHKYISAIITEKGIIRPPFKRSILAQFS